MKAFSEKLREYKDTCSVFKFFFKMACHDCPSVIILYGVRIIVNVVGVYVPIVLLQMLLDNIQNAERLIFTGVLLVVSNGVIRIAKSTIYDVQEIYRDKLDRYCQTYLSNKVMKLEYGNLESPQVLEQLQKAKTGIGWYSGGPAGIISVFSDLFVGVISFLIGGYITLTNVPVLAVAIIFYTILNSFFNDRINKVELKYFESTSKINRVFTYLYEELNEHRYIKENRLFSGDEMIAGKIKSFNRDLVSLWSSKSKEQLNYAVPRTITEIVRDIVFYLYLGTLAIKGLFTIGEFTMLLSVCGEVTNNLSVISYNILELNKRCKYAKEYVKFMELEDFEDDKRENEIDKNNIKIEFSHVSFRYPATEKLVLRDITVSFDGYESIALVGENGAGKSTFIKLLCGLYSDYDGVIRVNGKNIKEYDVEQYRSLISTVFQDFKLFSYSISENIRFADESEKTKREVEEYLKKVGMGEKIDLLEEGSDSIIHKNFAENGYEPSGGEAQRIAIARALYKKSQIYVMDEANAALDPEIESEINRLYIELFKQKLSIIITHRLASCRTCDRIIVFHNGEIVERGTHEELMKIQDGYYQKMFLTQKNMFQGIETGM